MASKIPERCTRADDEFHPCNCDCVGYERDLEQAEQTIERLARLVPHGEDCPESDCVSCGGYRIWCECEKLQPDKCDCGRNERIAYCLTGGKGGG